MRAELLQQAERIFNEVVELPGAHRAAVLTARCDGDAELRGLVERLLLNHDDRMGGFLRTPAFTPPADAGGDLPQQIGRYRVLRRIGEGGMGVVYEARQDSPDRTVALKVIRPGLTSAHMLRRFQFEADVLGQLQHPGIAQIYEAGTAEVRAPGSGVDYRQPYFAMELVRGQSLTEYAAEHSLGTRDRMELVAAVADAVQHAHQHGVIHRDLKPGNILVVDGSGDPGDRSDARGLKSRARVASSTTRSAPRPKILDFGVARATDADVQTVTLQTDVGQLVGTVPYMSPEQVRGDPRQVDTRSDVYALGVILYELLAGRLPYDVRNRSVPEAARIINEEEPSRLSAVNVVFRGDVETIVARAIEKDKERRYGSAEQFAADIRRYLRDEPILARPPSAFYQLAKFARRNRALVGGIATAFVALLVASVGMTWFALRESGERRRAERALNEAREARDAESRQRELAERRFGQVRALARSVMYDMYDELDRVPGATRARAALMRTALVYLDGLSKEAGSDEKLMKELAQAYSRLGDVQGKAHESNAGGVAGALDSYEKCVALAEALRAKLPDDADILSFLAGAYESLAVSLRAAGQTPRAMETYEKARDAARAAVALRPDDDNRQRAAIIDAGIGRLYGAMGRHDAALEMYRTYQAHVEEEHRRKPDDRIAHHNAAMADSLIAEQLRQLNRPDEALEHFRRALKTAEGMLAKHGAVEANSLIATICKDLGALLVNLSRFPEALPLLERSLALQQERSAADPSDFRAQRNTAVAHVMIAVALERQNRHDEALIRYEQYRQAITALAQANPDYVVIQRDSSLAALYCGRLKVQLKRFDDARADLLDYRRQSRALFDKDPSDALACKDVGVAIYAMGQLEVGIGNQEQLAATERIARYRAAVEQFTEALRWYEQLLAERRLAKKDEQEIDKCRAAIKACNDEIANLERGAASSQPNADRTSTPGG